MLMYAGSECGLDYVQSWFKAEEFKQLYCDAQDIIKDLKWLLLVAKRFFTSSHLFSIASKV